eukprot:TRINITY_DN97614_c0_g1_i1.p1 TRINITY_DN97614_c0_g1~~TRINITY_DN97614_c0_g1_i1.p1  ORF type:complete len:244 (+),score=44.89 TRINITY_DN97614_c0_g1_i1:106-837(+)
MAEDAAAAPAPQGAEEWSGEEVPGPGKITAKVINEDPRVVLLENFVSQEEVDHLIKLCEGRWERSLVSQGKASDLHGANNGEEKFGVETVGDTRTSSSVHVTFEESMVVERIGARVASVAGTSLEYVEPLVVLKYEAGQFFKMHHDGSMRPHTVFVYLNDVEPGGGGSTHFPGLGFEVHPRARTALLWPNRLENGEADMRMKHEAKALNEGFGIKYAMNCFVNMHPQRDTSHIALVPSNEQQS